MGIPIDAIWFNDDILVSEIGIGDVVWVSDFSVVLPIDGVNIFALDDLATDGESLWVANWGSGLIWKIGFGGRTQWHLWLLQLV